tara:strand:+ start:1349 stop:1738 length:390 start_codon:yes stop_codon:yes gene_type:complete
MSRLNRKKLISLDDECWRILESETSSRMQSVYVRTAIVHYYKWRQAGIEIPLVKDGTLARRFDANTINMRILEKENQIETTLGTLNEKIIENIELKKSLHQLEKTLEIYTKRNKKLKKWWHFFFVGFRR